MSALRREVELPRRPYERVSFYLGVASLLLSLLIVLDAAGWPGSAVRAAAAETRQAALQLDRAATAARVRAARLRAARCRAALEIDARAAAAAAHVRADLDRDDVHGQLMRELDRSPAMLDDPDRYGKMNHVDEDAVRRYEQAAERSTRPRPPSQ